MHSLVVEECFSSPQPAYTKSETFKFTAETQVTGMTIGELKNTIAQAGYPKLSDASCITLLLPERLGVLVDEMIAPRLQADVSLLVLASRDANQATHLQAEGGINVPSVLYIYRSDQLKFHCKLPQSIAFAGTWASDEIPWSASLLDLLRHFGEIGFNRHVAGEELQALARSEHPDFPVQLSNWSAGRLGPALLCRLWKAADLKGRSWAQLAILLHEQTKQVDIERSQLAQKLQFLKSAHASLTEKLEYESSTFKEVSEGLEKLQQADKSREKAVEQTTKVIQEVKENLLKVVSCSNCSQLFDGRYVARSPIHLSCGHVFCKSCVQFDWMNRALERLQPVSRCLQGCRDFDPSVTMEHPLYVEDLKKVWNVISEMDAT